MFKQFIIVLLFLVYLTSIQAFKYATCHPPQTNGLPIFPKQYIYNHGESISVGYPHKYFLRCINRKWY